MTVTGPASRWIIRPRPNPRAVLRLVCFPYAGGSAWVFRTWPDALPAEVELWAIALPGRDARSSEPLFDRATPLIQALADVVGPVLQEPFAIYGHSMGALVGFGFARELHRRSQGEPVHLFVSGRRAPQLPGPPPLYHLPEPEFVAALRRFGGTPEAVLDNPELLAYFLPILRADIAVSEAETIADDEPLRCPITALGGLADERASPDELDAWRSQTTGAFDREMFDGGHFFIHSERAAFLGALARRLARIAAAP